VIGLVEDVLGVVLAIAAVVVFLSLFVSVYAATFERRREIATMRALGARRTTVFAIVLLEATAIALVGAVAGILVGHGAAYLGGQLLAARGGPVVHPFAVSLLQPGLLVAVVAIGALAGLVPALLAYRTEVAENLAPL
jgi:putative ABC transport system permease protein